MEKCLYCGRPVERFWFGRATRCTDCQRVANEDARRLAELQKDPHSHFNRVWFDPMVVNR